MLRIQIHKKNISCILVQNHNRIFQKCFYIQYEIPYTQTYTNTLRLNRTRKNLIKANHLILLE